MIRIQVFHPSGKLMCQLYRQVGDASMTMDAWRHYNPDFRVVGQRVGRPARQHQRRPEPQRDTSEPIVLDLA